MALLARRLARLGRGRLAGVLVLTLGAGRLHIRSAADVRPALWLVNRALAGLVAGGLLGFTLIQEDRLAILPWLQLVLLVLGVLASNREPVIRRQIFAAGSEAGGRA